MKTQISMRIQKVAPYAGALFLAAALVFGPSMANAEDDMMGTISKTQPPAQSSPMKDNSSDTISQDHKKMMKRNFMAQTNDTQKMGKMRKKQMPMNNYESDMMKMNPMESDKTKKPADPMPADGMDHM